VRGQVRQVDGKPLDAVIVIAFDQDLRSRKLLGRAQPQNGQYEIRYGADQLSRSGKDRAD